MRAEHERDLLQKAMGADPAGKVAGFASKPDERKMENAFNFEHFLELLVRIALLVYNRPPADLKAGPTKRVQALAGYLQLSNINAVKKMIATVRCRLARALELRRRVDLT